MKNIIITVLSIAVIVLGGYLVYDKVIDKNNKVESNNEVEENKNNVLAEDKQSENEIDEELPFFEGLKGITYHFEGDGINTFDKTISDSETIKEVLLVIKDKEEMNRPEGLGGAFSRYLLLKYEDFDIEISMPYNGIISVESINSKYYKISADAYAQIEKIFGYHQ